MEIIILFISITNTILLLVVIFLLRVVSIYLLKKQGELQNSKNISTQKTNENQASRPLTNDSIQFSEENPIKIDADTKYQVEGGDSMIPPEYN